MSRWLITSAGSFCRALFVAGLLIRAHTVLGQTPANPLRPIPQAALRIRADNPQPTMAVKLTDEPPEAPSVVPKNFGQPELLPAPAADKTLNADAAFDPSIFDDSLSQQFVHPLFTEPWFSRSDPNDPHRHVGIGQPLVGTSWRNRPWFFGTFLGGIMMDDLVSESIYQNDTTFVGLRLGHDFDHFWGLEGRTAFARPDLADRTGAALNPASRNNFGDVALVYYPLGDARWRPYLSAGLGFTTFRFNNELGQRVSEAALEVPLGVGMKYYCGPWFSLRFDFTDNLAIGNERLSGMHNVSLMAGAEFRFGGRRPSYFPWHGSTTYW